ncbi:MAG: glycine cleavage system aminomethyltransferase GcvT [Chloroflexi bacterium]|nr:glycine cleavage system aminomethyltransferase GcvT [Chloroflexota bacterium]
MTIKSPDSSLRRTILHDKHVALGGRMVPFAGWEMPVQYAGIVEETRAVRERAGVFDVSHMGRLFVSGPNGGDLLRRVLTYNIKALEPGKGHYALLCNDEGGILDDPYTFRLGPERWMVIPNAATNEQDIAWIRSHIKPGWDVRLDDRQEMTAMLALQGPGATHVFGAVLSREIEERLGRREITEVMIAGHKATVSRTGYTGEDGFEFVSAFDAGRELWDALLGAGVTPCGLGARDTLRLEAALALYGNDIDATTNPFEAGLGWTVSLDDGEDFVGRAALANLKGAATRRLACFVAEQRGGVFRHGQRLLYNGEEVGISTSGGHSPTLGASIGMGYLPKALTVLGTEIAVDVRGRPVRARIVKRPFVKASI